jgi:hypothetical protein
MALYRIARRPRITAEGAKSFSKTEAYFDRALRLIPADVVAAYLTVRGFWIPNDSAPREADPLAYRVLNWWLPILGLVAAVVLRILGTSRTFGKFDDIQWRTVIISGIAFLLWVLAVQNPVFDVQLDPRVPPSLLILFTLLVPFFQKGS